MKRIYEKDHGNTNEAEIVNIDREFDNSILFAKKLYFENGIFIYPTDTVYGLGGNPFNEKVVNRISIIKGRASSKKYILLIDDISTLINYVEIKSEKHYDFLISLWPNPVSVVMTLNKKTSGLLKSDTAAFRIPHNRFCSNLLENLKMPLVSTSVNRSNKIPLNEFSQIHDEFSTEVEAIFYSEKKSFTTASTLIDLTKEKPVLIREGKIKFEKILQRF